MKKNSGGTLIPFILLLAFVACVTYLIFFREWSGTSIKQEIRKVDVFGEKKGIKRARFITIPRSSAYNPEKDKNFFVLFWFKGDTYPQNGQEMQLLAKYDTEGENPGFALRIANYNSALHPQIYWKNSKGEGRWYSFADIKIPANKRRAFLISFTDNQFLGLHLFFLNSKKYLTVRNLGGHEVLDIFPDSKSKLRLGSLNDRLFSGQIGKTFVISDSKLQLGELSEFLQDKPDFQEEDLKDFKVLFYRDNFGKNS